MTATQDFGRTEVAPLIDRFLDLHPAVQIALHLSDGVVDLVEQLERRTQAIPAGLCRVISGRVTFGQSA